MNDTSCVFEIIHMTIQQSSNTLSISRLCATAGVSRSGYYAWMAAEPLRFAREEQDRKGGSEDLKALSEKLRKEKGFRP